MKTNITIENNGKVYNPANFEDVISFFGKLNQAIYGVNPYAPTEKKLKVFHGYGSQENEVQIDRGEGFCYHQCSGNCRRVGCNCECGEFHIPKS